MDITKELNQIIVKYELDKHYPQYRKMLKAHSILHSMMRELAEKNKKVAFIVDNDMLVTLLNHFGHIHEDFSFLKWTGQELFKTETIASGL